jgi:hypothetical protein
MTWSPLTRIAFRFCFSYFTLYALVTQIFGDLLLIPGRTFQGLGPLWPLRELTVWLARNVFGITAPVAYRGNSLDTNFYWVQTAWVLAGAAAAAGVWSVLDRRRAHYLTLHKWFHLLARIALASQMFKYGMAKVIPTQMPAPSLLTLVEPVGHVSLQGLLWTAIGASPPYQVFTGLAEVLGGLLLLFPRTTVLGALICLADLIQVFALNMTFDIGVKQLSFHLILLTVVVLGPDLRRLADFLVFDRETRPSRRPPLFRTARANRVAGAAQVAFGLYLLAVHTSISWGYWFVEGGGGSPRSPLYGIWDIETLAIDGEVRSPLLNDYDRRWRRVIFDAPGTIIFQRTDDSFARYGVAIDVDRRTMALTKGSSRAWSAAFAFDRPAHDRLILEGEMDDYRISVQARRVDFDSFRLLHSTFRWIRPPDP